MTLTERELTLIIEELEVDEDIYNQMIQEEIERGNEPEPRHLEVLNLLNKLRGMRGWVSKLQGKIQGLKLSRIKNNFIL